MIIKFVIKFLPTCLPSGLTVAAPDAFCRIPGVKKLSNYLFNILSFYVEISRVCAEGCRASVQVQPGAGLTWIPLFAEYVCVLYDCHCVYL